MLFLDPFLRDRWSPQEDSDLVEGVTTNLKQQLVNPLIQRLQLIRDKLAKIVDPVEVEIIEEKKQETQDALDRVGELEDLEDLMQGLFVGVGARGGLDVRSVRLCGSAFLYVLDCQFHCGHSRIWCVRASVRVSNRRMCREGSRCSRLARDET